jgi:hypothetical protein
MIAPAALYQEWPAFGGDGRAVQEAALEIGLASTRIPVPSLGSVSENAAIIRAALALESEKSVVLVSLSKGGADTRVALTGGGAPGRAVRSWLQIGGLIRGTPLVSNLLAIIGRRLRVLGDLSYGPGSLLSSRFEAPPGMQVINVVGFPLTRHLRGRLRSRHRKLAQYGPNDGCTLLRDAIVEPGSVYPVWGADHYFRLPGMDRLLRGLLRCAAASEDEWDWGSAPVPTVPTVGTGSASAEPLGA